ncbi:MAG: PLP-dependent aminotransferase family protein [Firmicutes bacterium]|nr:PLP-dependent aminotransferase family protein [Bacillota bacterium]
MTRTPEYMKIYLSVREKIVSGIYPFGSRIPSKRTTAADFGVSVITAEHSYEILAEEGYIEARERSGYYVIYKDEDIYSAAPMPEIKTPHTERGALSLGSEGSGTGIPFPTLSKFMRRTVTDCGERLLVKSPGEGCRELRESLSKYLSRCRGINVPYERIVIGGGSEYLYGVCVEILGFDRVALENPSYEKIRRVYESRGVTCDMLKMGSDGIFTEELSGTSADVLHVTPFQSFPSGITASASKRREYVKWANQRCGYLIEDDYDSEFSPSSKTEDTLFSLSEKEDGGRVIYLNTFSRTVAPSLRAGYMILPERLVDKFEKNAGLHSCTVPVFEQYLLSELIDSGEFERNINRVRRKRRRDV